MFFFVKQCCFLLSPLVGTISNSHPFARCLNSIFFVLKKEIKKKKIEFSKSITYQSPYTSSCLDIIMSTVFRHPFFLVQHSPLMTFYHTYHSCILQPSTFPCPRNHSKSFTHTHTLSFSNPFPVVAQKEHLKSKHNTRFLQYSEHTLLSRTDYQLLFQCIDFSPQFDLNVHVNVVPALIYIQ